MNQENKCEEVSSSSTKLTGAQKKNAVRILMTNIVESFVKVHKLNIEVDPEENVIITRTDFANYNIAFFTDCTSNLSVYYFHNDLGYIEELSCDDAMVQCENNEKTISNVILQCIHKFSKKEVCADIILPKLNKKCYNLYSSIIVSNYESKPKTFPTYPIEKLHYTLTFSGNQEEAIQANNEGVIQMSKEYHSRMECLPISNYLIKRVMEYVLPNCIQK